MLSIDYSSADKFVNDQTRLGNSVRWDGWSLVFFKPTHFGFSSPNGAFRNGRWGIETRIPVSSDGTWKVARRYVKHSR